LTTRTRSSRSISETSTRSRRTASAHHLARTNDDSGSRLSSLPFSSLLLALHTLLFSPVHCPRSHTPLQATNHDTHFITFLFTLASPHSHPFLSSRYHPSATHSNLHVNPSLAFPARQSVELSARLRSSGASPLTRVLTATPSTRIALRRSSTLGCMLQPRYDTSTSFLSS
jgi:hypothetical protein